MNKYRPKSTDFEAFQMTCKRRWNNEDWPGWLLIAWQKKTTELGAFFCGFNKDYIYLNTKSGEARIQYGDWIIQGPDGELYPCKPDIFHATYEEVI